MAQEGGRNNIINASSPVQVGSETDWALVAIANYSGGGAVTTGGELYMWGFGNAGFCAQMIT